MQLLIARHNGNVVERGDIVEVRASGTPFGGAEPNSFVVVEIPEPMTAFEQYQKKWESELDYAVVASNLAIDGFRIRLFSTTQNSSANRGSVTRVAVERFINAWNGTVFSFGQNEVVFDITIAAALQSQEFWDADLTGVTFTELNYTQGTGVHRMQCDYSARGGNPTSVERHILSRGGEIVSHAGRVLVADFTRADVRDQLINDIKRRGKQEVAHCRYRVPVGVVTAVEGQGGVVTTDLATLSGYIRDKVAD